MTMTTSKAVVGQEGGSLPSHLRSMLGYICTLPNLMGYTRALLIFAGPVCHHLGYAWLPPLMYVLNLCVVDNLDGIVARLFGQCTQFGRVLDISTDVASETVFMGCIAVASLNSTTLPAFLTGYGFWICLLFYRWFDTVGCMVCIAVTFSGSSWKDVRYPCPVTRWYYETNLGGYTLYIGYHVFLAALYLAAEGQHENVGCVFACVFLPAYLLRLWTGLIVDWQMMKILMQMDVVERKKHSKTF
mmetsp:Transcript_64625/g.179754  ORF Transcript_64625/g.179754 Transcript_64625/m.179754 type:complete len:244 (+) Transcript_64625:78-809(+)